jgi:peroxiredoxin
MLLRTTPSAALAVFAGLVLASPCGAAVIPRPAGDYTIQLSGGKTVQLKQYRGKVIALEFILTTCADCQQTAQILQSLQNEFGAKGFQALGAALNENAAATLPDFIRVLKVDFPVGTASPDAAKEFLQHPIMTTMMMPQLVFIDRAGQIQAQFPGNHPLMNKDKEKNIRKVVEKLVSGATAPRKAAKPAQSKKNPT